MNPVDPLYSARLKVSAAAQNLREAEREASTARSRECSARNELNAAQREFDAAVEAVRKEAGTRGSEWAEKRRERT